MLNAYASALDGIPHGLARTGNVREELGAMIGPPSGPVAIRVSATRHAGTGTNRSPTLLINPKFALTFLGVVIANVCGFAVPVTSPLQFKNAYPEFGAAVN